MAIRWKSSNRLIVPAIDSSSQDSAAHTEWSAETARQLKSKHSGELSYLFDQITHYYLYSDLQRLLLSLPNAVYRDANLNEYLVTSNFCSVSCEPPNSSVDCHSVLTFLTNIWLFDCNNSFSQAVSIWRDVFKLLLRNGLSVSLPMWSARLGAFSLLSPASSRDARAAGGRSFEASRRSFWHSASDAQRQNWPACRCSTRTSTPPVELSSRFNGTG